MKYLTILKSRSLKSRCWQGLLHLRAEREDLFHVSPLDFGSVFHSLAFVASSQSLPSSYGILSLFSVTKICNIFAGGHSLTYNRPPSALSEIHVLPSYKIHSPHSNIVNSLNYSSINSLSPNFHINTNSKSQISSGIGKTWVSLRLGQNSSPFMNP